jgi:hypothetical protein
VIAVVVVGEWLFPPVRETVYETFVPQAVNTAPVSKVRRVVYNEDPGTLIIYFSNRPRIDYYNFPKEEYQALERAKDQSAYYFEHIQGQYKPY